MIALAALLMFGVLGAAIPSDRDIARQIEEVLREHLHPRSVQVTVSRRGVLSTTLQRVEVTLTGFSADALPFTAAPPAGAPALRGGRGKEARIIDLVVSCADFEVNGLPIAKMDWQLRDVRVPLAALMANQPVIAAADTAVGSVVLAEAGVSRYLLRHDFPLNNLAVRLTAGGCRFTGKTRTFVRVPVAVSGRVGVRGEAVLFLEDPRMHLSGVRVPGFVTDRLLGATDPLIDLNVALPLPARATITKITHEKGAVRFDATMAFPRPE